MIRMFDYSFEEVETLYSIVEESVKNKKPIDMQAISEIIKIGDFYLHGVGMGGELFTFNGLKWVDNNRIYYCLIQPQLRNNKLSVQWMPVGSVDDRDYRSSGNLSMIQKENRYISTEMKW